VKAIKASLRGGRGAALAGAMLLALALAAYWYIAVLKPYTTEIMTFGTNVVAGTSNDEPVNVKATLYIPKKTQFPLSAVIIMPSSSGVEDVREVYYAEQLTRTGIAALVVDSFSARGLADSVYDQSAIDVWDMENDAIAALAKLAKDPRFKSDRIAILGVSKGGTTAMNNAFTVRRRWMGVRDVAFAAHVAISPDCTWVTRRANTTGAPIMFLLAELDDQTPAQPCLALADRMRKTGNAQVETKIYKGAHHAWEDLGWFPLYDARAENYAQCRVWVEEDGRMISAETGEIVPEDDWHGWAKKNCMTVGATCCGGSRRNRNAATEDIVGFLRRHGF
jgi:dienelactone hydrolase